MISKDTVPCYQVLVYRSCVLEVIPLGILGKVRGPLLDIAGVNEITLSKSDKIP